MNNLRQVSLAIRLYSADFGDALPELPNPHPYPEGVGAFYKQLVKGYVGLRGPASSNEAVFTCPADRYVKQQEGHAFTSFTFNGYEVGPDDIPRITGHRLGNINQPGRAVLVGEWPAFFGGSWHPFVLWQKENAKANLGFVDGHVAFTPIYWNGVLDSNPCSYEPPAGYAYDWDGE